MFAAVITVSDRCFRKEAEDRSGPILVQAFAKLGWDSQSAIVPDNQSAISDAIGNAVEGGARVVITSGGTGVSPRDVTPEATKEHLAMELPGVSQLLMEESLRETPFAAFGRGLAGLTGGSPRAFVINIPGSPKAANTTVRVLFPLFKHMIDQLDQSERPTGAYVDHPVE